MANVSKAGPTAAQQAAIAAAKRAEAAARAEAQRQAQQQAAALKNTAKAAAAARAQGEATVAGKVERTTGSRAVLRIDGGDSARAPSTSQPISLRELQLAQRRGYDLSAANDLFSRLAGAQGIDEPSATALANDVDATGTDAQINKDVAELQALAATDPAAAAALLEQKLLQATPEYREQLVAASQPVFTQIGAMVAASGSEEQLQATVDALSRCAELVGPQSQALIGQAFVAGVPEQQQGELRENGAVGRAITEAITRGSGAAFGFAVADATRVAGLEIAESAMSAATTGVNRLQECFGNAQERVDQLNAELYTYLETFGPLLSDEQKSQAISEWMARHAESYAEWERLGGQMAAVLSAVDRVFNDPNTDEINRGWAGELLANRLPQVAQTQAGQELLADAIAAKGIDPNARTILDTTQSLGAFLGDVNDTQKFLDTMAALTVKATGAVLVQIAREDPARAARLLSGLSRSAGALNVPQEQMDAIASDLKRLVSLPTGDEAGAKRILRELDQHIDTLDSGANGRLQGVFKGLGLALAAASLVDGWANMEDAEIAVQIQTLAQTVELGADSANWALQLMGHSSKMLTRIGAAAGGIAALFEFKSAYDSYVDGNISSAAGHGFIGFGSVLISAGLMSQAVPVVGWVVGTAAILGGGVLIAVGSDGEQREARQQFLQDAGFDEATAAFFAEQPATVMQQTLANLAALGFGPQDISALGTRHPSLVDGTLPTVGLVALARECGITGPELLQLFDAVAATATGEDGDTPGSRIRLLVGVLERIRASGETLNAATLNRYLADYQSGALGGNVHLNEQIVRALEAAAPYWN